MGNSSSQQQPLPEEPESKSDSTEFDQQLLQARIASAQTYMRDAVRGMWESPGVDSFLHAVSAQFTLFGGKEDVFKTLQTQIKNCENSYEYYKTLRDNDIVSKEYPERISAALDIHQRQWKLLSQTSSMLQDMQNKIVLIKDSVEDFQDQLDERNPDPAIIQRCIGSFVSWTNNSKSLETLANEWNQLLRDAQNEQDEWEKIKKDVKKKLVWKRVKYVSLWVGAFVVVAGIGIAITCALCPHLLPWVAKEVAEETAKLSVFAAKAIIGAVVGVAGLGAVVGYNVLSKDIDNCKLVLKLSEQIRDEMAQAANNAQKVEIMVRRLIELMKTKEGSTERIKNSCNGEGVSLSTKRMVNRIKQSLKVIGESVTQFEKQCKDLQKVVKTTQNHMIKVQSS